ncbi:bifunctional UDP-N-acetylglucosamine diphosphorylase/glucosamine-1-phosphate N-acetyltransferase GlmU [Magnetovibrio sp. PR-2]|uniref:bifunctional UDP-N-acetylglucosamine diphosphorylase/glucosamine-1-phosphate N-acetyltransferase GlmU n=1 Tax=Magnetovibrio sp. PR-2 TaxID=3120356 RepID=UPI002FCE53BC
MSKSKTAAIILAAGLGTRMKSEKPKVMHPVAGRPMVQHLLATCAKLKLDKVVVVVGPDMEDLEAAVAPHTTAVQYERLGTGHAVQSAMDALGNFNGNVLVLYGDTPLMTEQTLNAMLEARQPVEGEFAPAVVVLGFVPQEPGRYGRLVLDEEDGELLEIVEANDASQEQLMINLCNSGVMCFDGSVMPQLLGRMTNDNAKGEYYLTDCVALAREDGFSCAVVEGDEEELLGINSRIELAQAEMIAQDHLREKAMKNGATLLDPSTTYFSYDTQIGKDVLIEPNVVFGPGVAVGNNVHIKAHCHFEDASIGAGTTIGPFARLRPGAKLAENVHVGNFVEIKNAMVEEGGKVNHLTYIGDARVGAGANIGAGTITCNYDGFNKFHTDIGAGAFIGSNTALVAPVKVGDGAIVGAGSTVISDVGENDIVTTRANPKRATGAAERFRERKQAEKDAKKKG